MNRFLLFISCFAFTYTFGADRKNTEVSELMLNFAKNIEASLENHNPAFFNASFDKDVFLNKIFMIEPKLSNSEYTKGFKEGFNTSFDLGSIIVKELEANGSYTLLRAYKEAENTYLVYRVFSDNGINYHEFEVIDKGGEPKIIDASFYLSGEKVSETISRAYKSFIQLNGQLTEESIINLQGLSMIGDIKILTSKGEYKKAFKKWSQLPSEIKQEESFQLIGLHIAANLNDEIFLKATSNFSEFFPKTSAKYLILFEVYLGRKYYDQSLNCIDSLDYLLHDPMLNYLRANVNYAMGNNSLAISNLKSLVREIPNFELGYYSMLGLYIQNKSYSDATVLLSEIVSGFEYYKGDMQEMLTDYPEFIRSQEFQLWVKE